MNRARGYVLLRGVVVAAFLLLIARLWYMQVVEVNAYRAQGVVTKTSLPRYMLAPRGIIYDRNGVPLVRNLPRLDVTINPNDWSSHGRQESRLLARLLHHHPGAARIRHRIAQVLEAAALNLAPVRPFSIKTDVTLKAFYMIRSHADRLPGVDASADLSHRVYLGSSPWPLAQILGYVGPISAPQARIDFNPKGPYAYQRYTYQDSTGATGIEQEFEHQLHGINGVQTSQIDALGNQVTPWKTVSPAVPGDGIRLTIDSRFENQVAQVLQTALQKLQVTQGTAVVMNPWNGQILAMVSLPSFSPNIFTSPPSRKRSREIAALNKPSSSDPQFNLATEATLPPGSIYKVITATAGLASGVITPGTTVDDTGTLQIGPRTWYGWMGPPGLGSLDLEQAIARSSDLYFYQVAGGSTDIPGGVGPHRLDKWARRYGLGQDTGIELPEYPGLVPTPRYLQRTQGRPWSYGDSYNMGVGQGDDLVTPLQMARVVSVIANGGSLVRPTIIEAVTGPNGHRILRGQNYGLVPERRPAPFRAALDNVGHRGGYAPGSHLGLARQPAGDVIRPGGLKNRGGRQDGRGDGGGGRTVELHLLLVRADEFLELKSRRQRRSSGAR